MTADTENTPLRIERLDAQRLHDLEVLYKAVYGTSRPADYFRQKYATAWTGIEYIGYIAYNEHRLPVAYYGVMPCFIQYRHEIILSAQSGDTMTHPDYRYKGLFVKLSMLTFELSRASGIKLIYGFPNQHSYPAMINKLGWKCVEEMERFVIPVAAWPLESLCRRLGRPAMWIYERYCRLVTGKYHVSRPGLPNALLAEGYAGVQRDERYFRYKTYNHTQVIQAGSACAWVKIQSALVIGDLDATASNFGEAIHAMKKIARRAGLSCISFDTSPGTALHALFAAKYTPVTSFPALVQDFGSGIPLHRLKFTFSDIDIF